MLALIFHCKENDGTVGAALLHQILPETGHSEVENIRKIHTAFGDDAMGITQIKEWYNRFKDGRTSVESEPRSGCHQHAEMTRSLPK